ncbi:aromatic amino acid transport family protein [uncultured Helicobacter sp.]|uniref:aromatic amino acid transport family protein n=1 Tax=uncultured Helicobacter sp. TaxID=175537 RepID=UPI00374E3F78
MSQNNKWSSFDTRWMLSLFGTAVGAGILYLPIKAGTEGFWPVVAMCIVIFPMVYLSHRALSLFVSQAEGDKDITHAAEEYFGRKVSVFISVLYFFAIFPICLAYCVGITNTIESLIYNQILPIFEEGNALAGFIQDMYATSLNDKGQEIHKLVPLYRAILVFLGVSTFMGIMLFSEKFITRVCELLVYPLCAALLVFSLYLIPYWSFDAITNVPQWQDFLVVVWLTLPVLVFSFNHSPAISTFALSVKQEYGAQNALGKSNQILFFTSMILLLFVMFFVFSCVLSLSGEELKEARAQNIPVLSYFANKLNQPIIAYGGPIIAFLAITTSFFGHYFGAREGAYGIVRKCCKLAGNENPNLKLIAIICGMVMYAVMLVVAYFDPSVLSFIENLGGPIIAAILFLMPIIAIWSVSKLKKFRNPALDAFVFITGALTIVTVIYQF